MNTFSHLSIELKREKATQSLIVFSQFIAQQAGQGADAAELLAEAAARCYRAKKPASVAPEDWVANEFAQYMRELVLEA